MLWILLALMCLLGAGIAILPFARDLRRSAPVAISTLVLVIGLSAGIYALQGRPEVPSGAGSQPDVSGMVSALAERLESQPDDINGWKMLGRSHMTLGNYAAAADAYRRAVELEDSQVAQTLVDYGVALARAGGETLSPQSVSLFENAIALAPNNPEALFWGGIAAFNRGDAAEAANRWERLLATNPPPEVQSILSERIAVWRGGEDAPPAPPVTANEGEPVLTVDISVADNARAALPADASVFVIARDPRQPSPPIAVARRSLSELPARVALSDRDAMIPGRLLSGFESFEVEVRASASGNPSAGPGDWSGTTLAEPAVNSAIAVEIATPRR
jgi:cytochrome c-type biogenesis protein CcmH